VKVILSSLRIQLLEQIEGSRVVSHQKSNVLIGPSSLEVVCQCVKAQLRESRSPTGVPDLIVS
jgi:hypothetical protein